MGPAIGPPIGTPVVVVPHNCSAMCGGIDRPVATHGIARGTPKVLGRLRATPTEDAACAQLHVVMFGVLR